MFGCRQYSIPTPLALSPLKDLTKYYIFTQLSPPLPCVALSLCLVFRIATPALPLRLASRSLLLVLAKFIHADPHSFRTLYFPPLCIFLVSSVSPTTIQLQRKCFNERVKDKSPSQQYLPSIMTLL